MIQVALVEDDPDLLEDLHFNLTDEGLSVISCADGEALTHALASQALDVVVLDLGLPKESGESIVRRLRKDRPRLGIIILSARSLASDRVSLMEDGADVYMSKPVDMRELALVIRALVRRLTPEAAPAPALTLIAHMHLLVTPSGQRLELSANETIVLARLSRATGQQLTRRQIIESLGAQYMVYDERRLEALMSRLRRKLEASGLPAQSITAVRGLGYALHLLIQERSDTDAA